MNIIVLVKTVRFLHAQTGSDPKQNYIAPGDLVDMMNPFDEAALEEALRIKDEQSDTQISVVSLGGPSAETGLRRSLAMGADRAVHIFCEDQLDAWATANALAALIGREKYQLILCGKEAVDDNAGLVGPYVAQRLAIPQISCVVNIERSGADGTILAQRRLDRGDREIVECSPPALLTIERDINVARISTLPAMMKARKMPIETLALDSLASPDIRLGTATSLTETRRLSNPKAKRQRSPQTNATLSPADRMKLMMKGGGTPAKQASSLMEGQGGDVLQAFETLLASCGVKIGSAPSD